MGQFLDQTGKKYYFIGIGGISMSALARYILQRGGQVSGSDIIANEQVSKLRETGISVHVGQESISEDLSAADVVV